MKNVKKFIVFLGLLLVSACVIAIGEDGSKNKKNPTLTDEIMKGGFFFSDSSVDKRTYSQFAEDSCKAAGYTGHDGYIVYKSWRNNLGSRTRPIKIWCK